MTVYLENSLWTLMSLIGIIAGVASALDARGDLSALRLLHKNGQRKVIARTAYRSEVVRIVVQTMFFAAGVGSFFSPPPINPHSPAAIMLIVASVLLVYNSIAGYLARREALAISERIIIERHEARDAFRDTGRDGARDPIRDEARDIAHDKEIE